MSNKITVYYSAVLGIFAFLMLVFPKLVAIGFILFVPYIAWGLTKKSIRFRWTYLSTFFVLLYIIYATYAIFTRHPDWAGTYLENKLSFVLLPFLLAFRPKEKWDQSLPVALYLFGLVCLLIQSYTASVQSYMSKNLGLNSFLSSEFSVLHHPTYFCVYLLLGVALLVYARRIALPYFSGKWPYLLAALFFVAYFQCLSLAGILFGVVLLGILVVRFIYVKWGKWLAASSVLLVSGLIYISVNYIPRIEGEWTSAMWYAKEYLKDPEAYVKTQTTEQVGSQERLIMWTVSGQAFAAYPMGVGTGNVDEVLGAFLRKSNQYELAKKELNPHNQYLQTGVETGIFGLLILLGVLISAAYYGIKKRNWILLIIACNLAFNMLFESMLQRQSGIVFYTFVLVLLAYYPFQKQEAK